MFRSRTPRAVVAALTAVVLIVGLMASATSAAPLPTAAEGGAPLAKPRPTPSPDPTPTPTPTPTPNSDNRIVYFGDAPRVEARNGVLVPSNVSAGNVYEFTLWIANDGSNRLTHAELGYGSRAVDQPGVGESLPEGASIVSATLITGVGSCGVVDLGLGALCDFGQFDAGESASVQIVVNAPPDAGAAFTYASFKVAENVPDQGANRNTFYANSSNFVIAPTNSNSNATYKLGGDFSLSTKGQTLVKKDSMTTTVTVPGDTGAGAISISETDCDSSCVGQIATVHVRDGNDQTPYLLWTLVIIGSIDGVITHELDDPNEPPVVISEFCVGDFDVDCIVSNDKNGNATTIEFRTLTNGRVKAG